MFTKFISKNIQEKLKSKERALAWKVRNTSQPTKPPGSEIESIRPRDIMSRTTFVRMCSNKSQVPNILISGGERDEVGQIKFGTDLYSSRGNQFRPVAGVKDISVEYKGGMKAIRECTVNWMVTTLEDLDVLTPYFLTKGKTVVVDWGWTNATTKGFEKEVPPFITKDVSNGQYVVDQSIFSNPQQRILEMKGDYDAIGGLVKNFNYTLREDGGFDCTTTITAMGAALFDMPIDKGSNQASTVIIGKPQAKSKIVVPPDNLINAIINLRKVIYYNHFQMSYVLDTSLRDIDLAKNDGWDVAVGLAAALNPWADDSTIASVQSISTLGFSRKTIEYYALFGTKGAAVVKSQLGIDQYFGSVFPNAGKGLRDADKKQIVSGKYIPKEGKTAVIVDDPDNPNVLLMTKHGHSYETFVTFGWFEDQIINRYVSFMGGKDNKDAKITMRSLDTVLHTDDTDSKKVGEPIEAAFLRNILQDKNNFDDKKAEAEKYGIILDADVDPENLNDVVKTPTLIRNPPLLFPNDPNKFFIKENIPTRDTTAKSDDADINKRAGYELDLWKGIKNNPNIREFSVDKDDTKPRGALRNIWVNIREIQSAFGVENPDAVIQDQANVKPPGTLENAIKNLLSKLNNNFNNVWNFELVTDPYDSTNIKVVDQKASVNSPIYSKFAENSHAVTERGIYKFPSFNIGSIVKTQNLEFKLPDSMAVTTLYSSNKTKGSSNESDLNNSKISKLFLRDEAPDENTPDVYADRYLEDLKKSSQSGDHGIKSYFVPVKIGSQNTSYNSKIINNYKTKGPMLIALNEFSWWWNRWVPGNKSSEQKDTEATENTVKEKEPIEKLAVIYDENSKTDTIVRIRETDPGTNQYKPVRIKGKKDELQTVEYYNYNEQSNIITMSDDAKFVLRSHLNSSTPTKSFSTDDIIPAELGLTIDGIGGIMPGDLIQTDYIQQKYNANIVKDNTDFGPLVYFQIFTLNQKVDSATWNTEINTKMRYNSIPDLDGLQFETVEAPPAKVLKKTPQPPAQPPEEPGEIGPDSAFSGFGLNNQFTLPPLETYKFKPSPEDYIEPVPEPEATPPAEEPFVGPTVINNGIPPAEEKPDAMPEKPMPIVEVVEEPEVPVEQEIIKVIKQSPGQPKITMPVVVKTVEPPKTAVAPTVTVVEYEEPEVAVIPKPKPKPTPPATPPPPTPPKIMETPTQKVKREQRQKAPKRKSNPVPAKTTYKADGADNRIIYRIIPLWRTEYASTQTQRNNGDYKQQKIYGEASGKTPVPKAVRQAFWDDNIEPPNSTGISNRAIVDSNEAVLLASGRYFSSTYIAKYDNR